MHIIYFRNCKEIEYQSYLIIHSVLHIHCSHINTQAYIHHIKTTQENTCIANENNDHERNDPNYLTNN